MEAIDDMEVSRELEEKITDKAVNGVITSIINRITSYHRHVARNALNKDVSRLQKSITLQRDLLLCLQFF